MKRRSPEWQNDYFGRHVQLVPAENAYGYQYRPYVPYADPDQIRRAIPAEGSVGDRIPVPAPQVDLRFGKPAKKTRMFGKRRAVTRTRRKRLQRLKTRDIIA